MDGLREADGDVVLGEGAIVPELPLAHGQVRRGVHKAPAVLGAVLVREDLDAYPLLVPPAIIVAHNK